MLSDGWYQGGDLYVRHLFFYVKNGKKIWQLNIGADPESLSGNGYIYPLLDFIPDETKEERGSINIKLLLYVNFPDGNIASLFNCTYVYKEEYPLIPWSIDKHYDSIEKKLGIKRTVLSKDQQLESLSFLEIF